MLKIRNLSKRYPGARGTEGVLALDDVSLDIPTGMFGLLGPNGAGKSSLMRTIATLQQPDSGAITLDPDSGVIDALADPDALRAVLGYLPQDFGTYPRISPLDLLDHLAILKGIGPAGVRRDMVDGLLHETNLCDVRKRRIDTFSGGMRQRFGIAQALLGDPRLIIVDEPTAGLDPSERQRFHNLLSRIGEQVIVILSTHIVEDVADLCPRMAILGQGRMLVSSEPGELIAALQGLVWTRAITEAEYPALAAAHRVLSTRLISGRRWVRVRADAAPDAGFAAAEPILEDVYFDTLSQHSLIAHGSEAAVA